MGSRLRLTHSGHNQPLVRLLLPTRVYLLRL